MIVDRIEMIVGRIEMIVGRIELIVDKIVVDKVVVDKVVLIVVDRIVSAGKAVGGRIAGRAVGVGSSAGSPTRGDSARDNWAGNPAGNCRQNWAALLPIIVIRIVITPTHNSSFLPSTRHDAARALHRTPRTARSARSPDPTHSDGDPRSPPSRCLLPSESSAGVSLQGGALIGGSGWGA